MEIIVTHQLTDFDGLAAMIAAKNLYPEAEPVFCGSLQNIVKDFMALYRDELNIKRLNDINGKDVEKVIIVDTANMNSLGKLVEKVDLTTVEVIVYDHHPHESKDWINLDLSEKIGAASSILVNKISAEGKELNPLEATICALGIYADTGSLTHESTTSADARAISFLLDSGANLKIIRQFMEEALNKEQQLIMKKLHEERETISIDGIDVNIFSHKQSDYVTGLNRVAEKIMEIYHLSSIFLVVKMGAKIEVIGRSNDDAVDIGKICSVFGGGGHKGAGAAQIKNDLEKVKRKLSRVIKLCVEPVKKVKSIMSTPVRTISPETTINDAQKFMEKYGHNGVIVLKEGKIKGVFSRRDLDKVKGHDLMHAPVKGYMSRDVITVNAEATIKQAQELMVKYNIGRLPVLKEDEMVGIVTRSDILGSYYEHETPHQYQNRYGSSLVKIKTEVSDISEQMSYFSEEILDLIKIAGQIAENGESKLFIIGGMVRDLLLERPNYDIDFVLEGNLREFLFEFENEVEGKVNYNEQFGTASIDLNDSEYNLDFATTRKEKYHYSGALPEVERANIMEDLFRRDYTVNALALACNPDKWGMLYDFFQGKKDLENKTLRALHRFSFLDDPTRIIRGVRLALNLNFNFENETLQLMREALKMGDFSELSTSRIYKELKILFSENINTQLAETIKKLPVFKLIYSDFAYKAEYKREIKNIINYCNKFGDMGYSLDESILLLSVFFNDIPENHYNELNLTVNERELFSMDREKLIRKLSSDVNKVEVYKTIENISIGKLIYLLATEADNKINENIKLYFNKLKNIELNINGNDLIEMGLEPGPEIKKVLNKIWEQKLKGKIKNKEEEKELASKLINMRLE